MSDVQVLGDILSTAAWTYEVSHTAALKVQPLSGVQCLEMAVTRYPGCSTTKLADMWNHCPKTMSTRERFRTLLEVCFEEGWRSHEEMMQ
jgi:hypothetical protein